MSNQVPGGQSGALRALWQGRLDEARAAYETVVTQTEIALKNSDLAPARRLALHREAAARDEFVRLLKVYADLVMRGVGPGE
ncbi:MAG TPA: hypothetical protein VMH28_30035 [Candidatus Acidoferrales bacterium]|nr:hypothetical protein [Candidatus Acidoferrales bacterium]